MKTFANIIEIWQSFFVQKNHHLKVVNIITLYRIITAPLLLYLIIAGHPVAFRWLLAASFFTDAVDGILARKFRTTSVLGSRLDSIGDDLTFAVAVTGLVISRPEFIIEQWVVVMVLFSLFFIQLFIGLIKYGKMTSFHTYLAKIAAILQAIFLLSTFFLDDVLHSIFYIACASTALDLIEEIILVRVIPEWKADVKGLYWVIPNVSGFDKSKT